MALDWTKYIQVGERFQHKGKWEDSEDLKEDIILRLAQVEGHNGHGPLTEGAMARVASYVVAEYWRSHYKLTSGLDCCNCSTKQRHKCRREWLYRECPKLVKLESLSKPITDDEGHLTELGETIADDKAIDLEEWVDARLWLLGCPKRLLAIADRVKDGEVLSNTDRQYLWYWRNKEQKTLVPS